MFLDYVLCHTRMKGSKEQHDAMQVAAERGKNPRILAAVSMPASLNYVGLYTIMLAKRMDSSACLLLVLDKDEMAQETAGTQDGMHEEIHLIQKTCRDMGVRLDCLYTTGLFINEVARYLTELDCAILVVGEGDDKAARHEELRRIERKLECERNWRHSSSHHFVIVARKNEPAVDKTAFGRSQ